MGGLWREREESAQRRFGDGAALCAPGRTRQRGGGETVSGFRAWLLRTQLREGAEGRMRARDGPKHSNYNTEERRRGGGVGGEDGRVEAGGGGLSDVLSYWFRG